MYQNPKYTKNVANQYLHQEIAELPKDKLILRVYDFAIVNSQKRDLEKTNKAIAVLISSLNFTDENAISISQGLMQLYQFCQDQTRKDNFDIVVRILSELRDTWKQVFAMNAEAKA